MYRIEPKMTIHFDLDGTICHSGNPLKPDCWTPEECLHAKLRDGWRDMINACYCAGHHVVIYTARKEEMRFETEYWLRKHGIKYHDLNLGNKSGSDLYVDDKAINSEDFHRILDKVLGASRECVRKPSE